MRSRWAFLPLLFLLCISFASAETTLQSVTLTATSNNQTLIASANATETLSANVSFFHTLYRNGTAITSGGPSTSLIPNTTRNFINFSSTTDGTYILQVIATNGTANTSATNSSALTVTYPRDEDLTVLDQVIALIPLLFVLSLFLSFILAMTGSVAPQYLSIVLGAGLAIIFVAVILRVIGLL